MYHSSFIEKKINQNVLFIIIFFVITLLIWFISPKIYNDSEGILLPKIQHDRHAVNEANVTITPSIFDSLAIIRTSTALEKNDSIERICKQK